MVPYARFCLAEVKEFLGDPMSNSASELAEAWGMSAHRTREPRRPVRIGARLKSGRGWSDIVLRNVSAREFASLIFVGAALAALLGGAAYNAFAKPATSVSQ